MLGGNLVRGERITLVLDLGEMLEHQLQAVEFAGELAAQPRRQGWPSRLTSACRRDRRAVLICS